jgi:multidrug efflux pump subunit AcrA (membrane-fusion protein)
LSVPFQAVDKDNNNQTYVYVVNTSSKTVSKKTVKLGTYQNMNVEVLAGLKVGDIVVSEGIQKLSDNSKIDY